MITVVMKLIWQCLFSPNLYKIYGDGPRNVMYQPRMMENFGNKMITGTTSIMKISLYTSPFISMYIYKRGFFTNWDIHSMAWLLGSFGCYVTFLVIIRACGRASNPQYVNFIKALTNTSVDHATYLEGIRKYDFDYNAWPVTYSVAPIARASWLSSHPFSKCANSNLPLYQRATIQILAYVATHTFGLRLVYPGSLGIVQSLLRAPLDQGRTQLVEEFDGKRNKLGTADGNTIDTMFVDQRSQTARGNTLVICCEGNAGFYEIGIMTTPVKGGFSTLGWNHPGFEGSTGLPYPSQEHNAIDVVMQYAINELNFKPEEIVLYGWSIGGYAAAWAAVAYPQVKALVLDATFDDLLPLAENQMPSSWSLLVKEVIRSYINLNIVELVNKYDGPVKLIRRTDDEVICMRQGYIATNRGNHLLLKLIEHRHSDVVADDRSKASFFKLSALVDSQRATFSQKNIAEPEKTMLELISKYMMDYESTHCVPLPEEHFRAILENIRTEKR